MRERPSKKGAPSEAPQRLCDTVKLPEHPVKTPGTAPPAERQGAAPRQKPGRIGTIGSQARRRGSHTPRHACSSETRWRWAPKEIFLPWQLWSLRYSPALPRGSPGKSTQVQSPGSRGEERVPPYSLPPGGNNRSISGGKETNQDSPSSGERTGKSPT